MRTQGNPTRSLFDDRKKLDASKLNMYERIALQREGIDSRRWGRRPDGEAQRAHKRLGHASKARLWRVARMHHVRDETYTPREWVGTVRWRMKDALSKKIMYALHSPMALVGSIFGLFNYMLSKLPTEPSSPSFTPGVEPGESRT